MTDPLLNRLLPSPDSTSGYLLWLSRPRFWLYLAGPVVVGVAYAAESSAELFAPIAVALFVYFLFPANVFLYGVNDVFDADIDTENPKKDERELRYQGGLLVRLSIVFAGLFGIAFLPLLPVPGVVGMVTFLSLSVEYSAPPFRFKTTPFLDSLSNGLYILPGVVAYAAVAGRAPPFAAIAGSWLWAMGMHTFSAIPDIDPDRAAGIETTATRLGEARTYVYCAGCWLAAALVFGTVHPFFAVVLGIYPIFSVSVGVTDTSVDRAYWWFPALNTAVGTLFTLAALWVMLYG